MWIDNVLIVERKVSRYYKFLSQIKSPLANDFLNVYKDIKKLSAKNVMEKGHVYSYEIPVKEIVEKWKSTEQWELRLLTITHHHIFENDTIEFISRLADENKIKSELIDMVSTNLDIDDFFTVSKQQGLDLLSQVMSSSIIGIISKKETLQDFFFLLNSAMKFISDNLATANDQLMLDTEYLIKQINMIAANMSDENVTNVISYGATMYVLAFGEKLLRTTFVSLVKNEIYVPANKGTYGELLNLGNRYMVNLLGETHMRCLSYFIIQTSDTKIGKNTRNELAHWNDISPKQMGLRFFSQSLWLFVDIMNTVFWYCIKNYTDTSS